MKIGILSDTHDQQELIEKAVALCNHEQVSLVVHCGDWVSLFILHAFKGLKAPIRGVFGNNDGDKFRHLQASQKLGVNVSYEDRFLDLAIGGRRIAVFHGDCPQIVDALVRRGTYDAIFHEHTHQKVCEQIGNTLSLNPGSLMRSTMGINLGASLAIYETGTNTARHLPVE